LSWLEAHSTSGFKLGFIVDLPMADVDFGRASPEMEVSDGVSMVDSSMQCYQHLMRSWATDPHTPSKLDQ